MGTVFYLLALALAKMTGINTYYIIVVIGIIIIILALLGGIEAVIWLDVVQGFLLFGCGIACLIIIILSVNGGLSAAWQMAEANNRTGFGPYNLDFKKLTFL